MTNTSESAIIKTTKETKKEIRNLKKEVQSTEDVNEVSTIQDRLKQKENESTETNNQKISKKVIMKN